MRLRKPWKAQIEKWEHLWEPAGIVNDGEHIQRYKHKLLSCFEYRTPAMYNACSTTLQRSELRITAKTVLFVINLALLACRRDIAMLAVIHRCVLCNGPQHFQDLFRLAWAKASITRNGARRHAREFIDIRNKDCLEIDYASKERLKTA